MRKFILFVLIILAFLGLGLWIKTLLLAPSDLPIQKISIYVESPSISQKNLQKIITPMVLKTNLVDVNLEQIKTMIENKPGVSYVDIERIWPNKIKIDIHKWAPVATWNKHRFINAYGEIFTLPDKPNKKIPAFYSDDNDSTIKMLDHYQTMNQLLTPLFLKIDQLKLSSGGSWRATLDNGVLLKLGYGDILSKIKLFVAVYPKLVASHSMLPKTVDLRYKHGMAVKW